jgi:radical SAM/Cys-rich protein
MNADNVLQERAGAEKSLEPFRQTLLRHGLCLERDKTTILQINVGLRCNQVCRHCHLSAGPGQKENMDSETAEAVIGYAARSGFEAIDITGGAPELNPNIEKLIEGLSPLTPRLMFRSNLSAITEEDRAPLMALLKDKGAVIIASFPSLDEAQADAQRGSGIFNRSIETLRKLNSMGYGRQGTGLELDLVSNPAGAYLPSPQDKAAKRFREVLLKKWGIVFNNLYAFANVPLGRFRTWLKESGNLGSYMDRLAAGFNPCAVEGLMCRSWVSISWDGYLYDCDFNLAGGLPMGKGKMHVSEMPGPPPPGSPIAVADHCFTCTAGAGFT